VTDVTEDDGVQPKHALEIEASLKGRKRKFFITASEFSNMGRVIE